MIDILTDILTGMLVVLAMVAIGGVTMIFGRLTLFVMNWLAGREDAAARQFAAIDRRLIEFGNTTTGQYLYTQAGQLAERFDEATDPEVQRLTALVNSFYASAPDLLRQILPRKDEPITADEMAAGIQVLFGGLEELLNGKALPSD